MSNLETDHLRRGYEFLLAAYGKQRWALDRDSIEQHLLQTLAQRGRPEEFDLPASLKYRRHPLAWYLFLVEGYLNESHLYEVAQGARIVPVVGRLGMELDALARVAGVEKRVRSLADDPGGDPDGTLFELLVAAAYVRNGWDVVELLDEDGPTKTPDLRVKGAAGEWFAECKRFRASSTYSLAERNAFWRMWAPLSRIVIAERLSLAIDVTFHRELDQLPGETLSEHLGPVLADGARQRTELQTPVLSASVEPARLVAVQKHVQQSLLRLPSSLALELMTGEFERFKSSAFSAHVRQSPEFPMFVESVGAATCVTWCCDDDDAVRKKARHIRRVLSEATGQLPTHGPGVVHIGVEALDGDLVERRRFEAIEHELARFDPGEKQLEWVYCHVFAPYVPPDKNFEMDETAFWASKWNGSLPPPLPNSQTLVVPDAMSEYQRVHWTDDRKDRS